MKIRTVLLRWYKSFHLNYREEILGAEKRSYRPWNGVSPSHLPEGDFPFIEIPIESDISTVVGGNESGKSHLLNAINKVINGVGIVDLEAFSQTDLCHYSGIRGVNINAWPNIGLTLELENESERQSLRDAVPAIASSVIEATERFTLILVPNGDQAAVLFIHSSIDGTILDVDGLEKIRAILPKTRFIDSKSTLRGELPLAELIRGYDSTFASSGIRDRKSVEQAVAAINALSAPTTQQQIAEHATTLQSVKDLIGGLQASPIAKNSLEMNLFRDILKIHPDTLKFIYSLGTSKRGYADNQVSKWNQQIEDALNLPHFWHQDDQFKLILNYKDQILYFEIHDKTECVYTFKERSSGLKYFLSYYIRAKALEMSGESRGSIILMDEPDAALSIVGQRNLLSVFESLVRPDTSSQACQLIYTTHSPYLINRNFPRRISVVKKEDAEEGTQFIEGARARRYEPVRSALGIDSAPSLFLGSDNILLEGATDQFILTELVRLYATVENVSEYLNLNSVVVVSADGVTNVTNVLTQSRWADEPIPATAVLLDSDDAGVLEVERITRPDKPSEALLPRNAVGLIGEIVSPFGEKNAAIVTTEDIIPIEIYSEAVRRYLRRWHKTVFEEQANRVEKHLDSPEFGKSGIVASVKKLFAEIQPEMEGDFDKMGLFQEVVGIVESSGNGKHKEDLEFLKSNVLKLCGFLNNALAEARAKTTQYAATRSIKRLVKDFRRLHRGNVSITYLQRLLRRMEREIEAVGEDGRSFASMMKAGNSDLEAIRKTGQVRLTGSEWDIWSETLEKIRRNPLRAANQWDQKTNTTAEPGPVKSKKPKRTVPKPQAEDLGDADSPAKT